MAQSRQWLQEGRAGPSTWLMAVLAAVACLMSGGCAALTNPVGYGIPARRLPAEYLAKPQQELETIPLTTLRQRTPDIYRLDKGDVLGVYIETVLGDKAQPPPVRLPEQGNVPPAIGFPIPVREDGTLPLPLIDPINVKGMTIAEAEQAVHPFYMVDKKLLQPDKHIFLSLIRPRTYRVSVLRQDGSGIGGGGGGLAVFQRRNTGVVVDLPAYENDLIGALNRTGGLPGVEALDEVIIQRDLKGAGTQITRIPMKLRPGEPLPFGGQDVILDNGDVVFVEARHGEVFYTGGLLQPRQFVVPRDYDLYVTSAVALAGGPLDNGALTQNNLSGNILASGLGSPNPSRVTVLRRTKHDGQIAILVDLNKAQRDPRENIIIQAGDVLILQETAEEAMTRYLTGIVHFNFLHVFVNTPNNNLTGTVSGP